MRRFLFLAHRVPVDGAFTLNDLAGGAGRMDEIARAVSTAFTLSNALRRDTEVEILFVAAPPPKARRIRLAGARLRYLQPEERSTAALLKNALVRSIPLERDIEASPGLVVGPVDPLAALDAFLRAPGALWLTEDGTPIDRDVDLTSDFAAVVSDPTDPTSEERARLDASGVRKISLGPTALRTSQCVDILHYEADRRRRDAPTPQGRPPESED
jgi:tRNA (pseudouridine54-N1)-methyltransferase